MNVAVHRAPPGLADSVNAAWYARGMQAEFTARDPIVPDGCVEMVFNLAAPFVDGETAEAQPNVR
jgi:hypothetical protein